MYVWFINNYHKSFLVLAFQKCGLCAANFTGNAFGFQFILWNQNYLPPVILKAQKFGGYFVIILLLKKCLRHQNKSWNRLATAKILYNTLIYYNENNFQILRNSFWVCNSCQTLTEKFRISHQVCGSWSFMSKFFICESVDVRSRNI